MRILVAATRSSLTTNVSKRATACATNLRTELGRGERENQAGVESARGCLVRIRVKDEHQLRDVVVCVWTGSHLVESGEGDQAKGRTSVSVSQAKSEGATPAVFAVMA